MDLQGNRSPFYELGVWLFAGVYALFSRRYSSQQSKSEILDPHVRRILGYASLYLSLSASTRLSMHVP